MINNENSSKANLLFEESKLNTKRVLSAVQVSLSAYEIEERAFMSSCVRVRIHLLLHSIIFLFLTK